MDPREGWDAVILSPLKEGVFSGAEGPRRSAVFPAARLELRRGENPDLADTLLPWRPEPESNRQSPVC